MTILDNRLVLSYMKKPSRKKKINLKILKNRMRNNKIGQKLIKNRKKCCYKDRQYRYKIP